MVPLAFRVVLDSMAISVFVVILGDFTNTESETSRLVKGGFLDFTGYMYYSSWCSY